MGPVHGLITGDDAYPFCSISNAAEEELAELAKLVGDGQKLHPAGEAPVAASRPQEVTGDWTQATAETAPRLNYDLEQELSRAFGNTDTAAPVEQKVETAPTVAEQPAVEIEAPVEIADAPSMAFEQEPDADFSNMIADELDRALAEEVAAEAALDAAMEAEFAASIEPSTDTAADQAIAAELSQLAAGSVEAPAKADVPMPVATEQTLDPWTTPEIVEPAVEAAPELAMPEVAPEAEWVVPAPNTVDYSDPAAEFAPVAEHYAAETVAVGAVASGAVAAAAAKPMAYAQAAPAEPVYVAPAEEEIMIPPPHMYDRPAGGAGKRIALAVVAVALMGGVAAAGWNMFDSSDGPAPTILAASEPAKVKPKDSGGKIVPNQDQAVYKSVGGENTAPKQAKLKDTSEKPIKVAAKSTPDKTVIRASAKGVKPETGVRVQPRRVRTVVVKPDGTIVTTVGNAAKKPLTVAAAQVTEPTLALKPELVASDAETQTPTASVAKLEASQPVAKVAKPAPTKVAIQKVPAKKVAVKKVPVKKVAVKKAPAKKAAPIKTASVSSPYAVQISSQRSAAAAQKSYATLSRRFASVIGGKGVDIRKGVIKGKGTYYRVRIPANSRSAANTICSRLKAKGGACFVTR